MPFLIKNDIYSPTSFTIYLSEKPKRASALFGAF